MHGVGAGECGSGAVDGEVEVGDQVAAGRDGVHGVPQRSARRWRRGSAESSAMT